MLVFGVGSVPLFLFPASLSCPGPFRTIRLTRSIQQANHHHRHTGTLSFKLGLKYTTGPTGGTQKGECWGGPTNGRAATCRRLAAVGLGKASAPEEETPPGSGHQPNFPPRLLQFFCCRLVIASLTDKIYTAGKPPPGPSTKGGLGWTF